MAYRAGARLLFPAALPTNVLDLATGTALDSQPARQVHNFAAPADHAPEPFVAVYPPVLMLVDASGMDTLFIHGAPGDPFDSFTPSTPVAPAVFVRPAITAAPPPTYPFTDDLPSSGNILRESTPTVVDVMRWETLEQTAWPDSTIPYTANILDDGALVTFDAPTTPPAFIPPAATTTDVASPIVAALGFNLHADTPTPPAEFHFETATAWSSFFAVDLDVETRARPWTDADLVGDAGLLGGTGPDVLVDIHPDLLAFPRMLMGERRAA